MWRDLWTRPTVKFPVLVCGAVLVLVFLNVCLGARHTGWRDPRRSVRALVHVAARNKALSDQDRAPVLALLHATTANSYLRAARLMATDARIAECSGIHVHELLASVDEAQQAAMRRIGTKCAKLNVKSDALRATGWLHP